MKLSSVTMRSRGRSGLLIVVYCSVTRRSTRRRYAIISTPNTDEQRENQTSSKGIKGGNYSIGKISNTSIKTQSVISTIKSSSSSSSSSSFSLTSCAHTSFHVKLATTCASPAFGLVWKDRIPPLGSSEKHQRVYYHKPAIQMTTIPPPLPFNPMAWSIKEGAGKG